MSLSDIVNVAITATAPGPTRENFGTPLVAAYHTRWGASTDRVRTYSTLAGLVSDGFLTTDPVYQIAAAVFSQQPRVKSLKVGRRTAAPTQTVDLTPAAPSNGLVYAITIGGSTVTYTASGGDNLAAVVTALTSAITALPDVTATAVGGTHLTVATDVAGTHVSYTGWSPTLTVSTTTTDPGIATDLTAIRTADTDWYGLLLDSNSKAEVMAAAAWAEANDVLFVAQTADSAALDGASTTDVLYALKAAGYGRTHALYHPSIASPTGRLAAALLGDRLPDDPGTDTWVFKTLHGVTSYTLTETQKTAVHAKNAGTYTVVGGVAITEGGKVAGGEWVDVVRGIDDLRADIRTRIFGLLLDNPKVAYTDAGVDLVKGQVLAPMTARVGRLLAPDPPPVVTAPKVADVDPTVRASRLLPSVAFTARLAGAIHAVDVTGTVSA